MRSGIVNLWPPADFNLLYWVSGPEKNPKTPFREKPVLSSLTLLTWSPSEWVFSKEIS